MQQNLNNHKIEMNLILKKFNTHFGNYAFKIKFDPSYPNIMNL